MQSFIKTTFQTPCTCCMTPLVETEALRCPCGTATYCSSACQVTHWKSKHQHDCNAAKESETIEVCGCCRRMATTHFVCACNRVYYCSIECQRKGWTRGHMHVCSKREMDQRQTSATEAGVTAMRRPNADASVQTGDSAEPSRFRASSVISEGEDDCEVDDLEPPVSENSLTVFSPAKHSNSGQSRVGEGGEIASSEQPSNDNNNNNKDRRSVVTFNKQQNAGGGEANGGASSGSSNNNNNNSKGTSRPPSALRLQTTSIADLSKLIKVQTANVVRQPSLRQADSAAVQYTRVRESVSVVVYKDIPSKESAAKQAQKIRDEILGASKMFEKFQKTGSFAVSEDNSRRGTLNNGEEAPSTMKRLFRQSFHVFQIGKKIVPSADDEVDTSAS